jgi:RHS repeat-associated protein
LQKLSGKTIGKMNVAKALFGLSERPDPLGTKRVQATIASEGTATLDLTCTSLPFGNSIGNSLQTQCSGPGADATEHHFTGKERDTESGNDYFMARYYSSAMGRFMSPDWSAKEEPVPYAQLDDPQSLNLYAYVRNNPLTRVDADGHCPMCITAAIGAVAGAAINVGITYFTKPDATAKDYEGAALHGALVGGMAGLTGGASLAVAIPLGAAANLAGGMLERKITTGYVGTLKEGVVDTAIGAAGPLLGKAGGRLAKAINGKDAEALESAAARPKLSARHAASLEKQAESARNFEETGHQVGETAAKGVEAVHRVQENSNPEKK